MSLPAAGAALTAAMTLASIIEDMISIFFPPQLPPYLSLSPLLRLLRFSAHAVFPRLLLFLVYLQGIHDPPILETIERSFWVLEALLSQEPLSELVVLEANFSQLLGAAQEIELPLNMRMLTVYIDPVNPR